ncbi:hypothetical protein FsymDg_0401 [Candidatus Protofrankia datiscae]|uniref:Uncharacterized protein n=1 Tax=Candidatus Protofrankia datiscae TaxID=2716812 RepID=F8B4L5_9ACTN|nr:hypothetical protein FsymDg_0401 [Candidatus Protofrankia datiscae]
MLSARVCPNSDDQPVARLWPGLTRRKPIPFAASGQHSPKEHKSPIRALTRDIP